MPENLPWIIRASDRAKIPEESQKHPLNPNSEIHGWALSDLVGLRPVRPSLLRVPPGKESFILHNHYVQEEFMYVLSGRGMARIGDAANEIGPGGFIGIRTPSSLHTLREHGSEDLVYLAGGEKVAFEIADFPTVGKHLVRAGSEVK